jgi:hypothetical protein
MEAENEYGDLPTVLTEQLFYFRVTMITWKIIKISVKINYFFKRSLYQCGSLYWR